MNALWLIPVLWFIIWAAMNKIYRAFWIALFTGALGFLGYALTPGKWSIGFIYVVFVLIVLAIFPLIRDV